MFNKISSSHEHMHLKGKIFLFLICFVKPRKKKTLKNNITHAKSKNKLPSREKLTSPVHGYCTSKRKRQSMMIRIKSSCLHEEK